MALGWDVQFPLLVFGVVFGFVGLVHFGPPFLRGRLLAWRVRQLRKSSLRSFPLHEQKLRVTRAHLGWPAVNVSFDALAPGVVVPEAKRTALMTLQFGRRMPIPIPDLVCNEKGIGGTLSFSGKPETTWVPWEAVYSLASPSHGWTWQWGGQLGEASSARVSRAVYQRDLRCPGCKLAPAAVVWICDGCQAPMNPFMHGSTCSKCGDPNALGVQCHGCKERFPLQDWDAPAP